MREVHEETRVWPRIVGEPKEVSFTANYEPVTVSSTSRWSEGRQRMRDKRPPSCRWGKLSSKEPLKAADRSLVARR